MKIAAIIGSIRKDSYNKKLAQFIQNRYSSEFDLEILDVSLPLYNQDLENTPPDSVRLFKQKIADADAVLWLTPEYNGTIPGALGNAIDWLSRVQLVMNHKPSWIMGASMGNLGTVKAQLHLREILFSFGLSSPLLPGNEVYIGVAHEKFDLEGQLIDLQTISFLDDVVANFLNWYHKIQP